MLHSISLQHMKQLKPEYINDQGNGLNQKQKEANLYDASFIEQIIGLIIIQIIYYLLRFFC